MVNFGPLAAEIRWWVWGTPVNFNGFRVLAALLHGTLVAGVSQTLRRWTDGATYIQPSSQPSRWALAHISSSLSFCVCPSLRLLQGLTRAVWGNASHRAGIKVSIEVSMGQWVEWIIYLDGSLGSLGSVSERWPTIHVGIHAYIKVSIRIMGKRQQIEQSRFKSFTYTTELWFSPSFWVMGHSASQSSIFCVTITLSLPFLLLRFKLNFKIISDRGAWCRRLRLRVCNSYLWTLQVVEPNEWTRCDWIFENEILGVVRRSPRWLDDPPKLRSCVPCGHVCARG